MQMKGKDLHNVQQVIIGKCPVSFGGRNREWLKTEQRKKKRKTSLWNGNDLLWREILGNGLQQTIPPKKKKKKKKNIEQSILKQDFIKVLEKRQPVVTRERGRRAWRETKNRKKADSGSWACSTGRQETPGRRVVKGRRSECLFS